MDERQVQYVEFQFPGSLFSESSIREVSTRDYRALTDIPEGCFGYRFFDRTEVESSDGEIIPGKAKNHSGMYFPGGKVLTVDDVKAQVPNSGTLVSYMEGNGCDKVVQTRRGNFQPFGLEDKIVE